MKRIKPLIILFTIVFCLSASIIYAQEEEQKKPEYIVVTQLHWNMDQEDFSMDEWKATEKEYLDKVIMKNDHIVGSSFFVHQFTGDNTEILYVQVYNSWNDIDLASKRNAELAKEAWPDKEARNAFFDKQTAYYSRHHSDEIYAIMNGAVPLAEMPKEDLTLYLRKSYFAAPEDGSMEEWKEVRGVFREKMVLKNEYIKGYYPSQHAYGAEASQFNEAFYVSSVADLDKMLDRQSELFKEAFPDENKRKEMGQKMGKYFTGVHRDYIYTYVAGLSK